MSLPRPDKISIALCTYNGERFLLRQLASMQQQTRLPDELIVCDDRSEDRTWEILSDFASCASFPVKLNRNRENLGSTKNFEQAIRLCSGDLIALSDQDDMWSPERLARCEQELHDHPEAGLVFSNGEIIDDLDAPIGKTLWQAFQFTPARRAALTAGHYDLLVKDRHVTGATVMLRSALSERFLPLPPAWIHDEWMAAIIAALAGLRSLDESLIFYRRHSSQQVGSPAEGASQLRMKQHWNTLAQGEKTDTYWKELARKISFAQDVCRTLSTMRLDRRGNDILSSYQAWLHFAEFRSRLPRRRLSRLVPVFRHSSAYAQHALGLRSAVKDIVRSLPQ